MNATPKTIARPGVRVKSDQIFVRYFWQSVVWSSGRSTDRRGRLYSRVTGSYFVSIFRLIFTVGRVSNWLTVLVSLLESLYWA
jgi:hypothetical protein